jgi:hypothetical protein
MEDVEEQRDAALADLALYKVEVIHLKNTIEFLQDENQKLKTMMLCTVTDTFVRDVDSVCSSSDAKKKREFYHRMKHTVAAELPPGVTWHVVKQYTDEMYEKERITGITRITRITSTPTAACT